MKLRRACTVVITIGLMAIGLWQVAPYFTSSFEVAREKGKKEINEKGPRGTKASRETRFADGSLASTKANQILLLTKKSKIALN